MPACEKCWGDAWERDQLNGKGHYENYKEILAEREVEGLVCIIEEQDGQFYEKRQAERDAQKENADNEK